MWTVFFLICSVFLLYGLERISLRDPKDTLFVSLETDRHLAEQEEAFSMILTAENRDRLPFSFVRIRQVIPEAVQTREDAAVSSHVESTYWEKRVLKDAFMIGAGKTLERRYEFIAVKRGLWSPETLQFSVVDLLGIREQIFYQKHTSELVVLPKPLKNADLSQIMGGIMGELSVRRFLFEDPVLISGFSDYTGREPMKAISFKQSAKCGRMIVKNMDHTTDVSICVVLDFENSKAHLETLLSLARSVCEKLEEMKVTWSFVTDGDLYEKPGVKNRVDQGTGRIHLDALLEGLGRTRGRIKTPFSMLCEELLHQKTLTSGYLILRGEKPGKGSYDRSIIRLSELTGCPVTVLYASDYEEDGHVQS